MRRLLISLVVLAGCYRHKVHLGDACDRTCVAPATCMDVVSVNGQDRECWLPCDENRGCPDGLRCTDSDDGPTNVCDR